MQSLEVSGAVRPIYVSLGVKRLITTPHGPREGSVEVLHSSLPSIIERRGW